MRTNPETILMTVQEYRTDVVVVGAGMTGLTAARLLAKHGRSVVVVEARDRIGGRIHTERRDGWTTDVGASWIHGIEDSPIADACAALGIEWREFTVGSFQAGGRPIAYFDPAGTRLGHDAAEQFIDDVAEFDESLTNTIAAIPAGSSYRDAVNDTLDVLGWDPERSARVREFMQHRTEEQYGAQFTRIDAHGLDGEEVFGDEVVFPGGYDQLPHRLGEGLDIRKNEAVTQIERGANGVTVVTAHSVFRADHVIVTVPVGVLHAGEINFVPELPADTVDALNAFGMNDFEKVILRYDHKFWDDDVYAIRRQGPAGDWWHSWYDLTNLHGSFALLTFAAGPCAIATRHMSDDEVAGLVSDALREMYGDAVPDPIAVHHTAWRDDPFAHGSYSYLRVGADTSAFERLAAPIDGVLQITGEATWQDDSATVAAAMFSGHRAAENVLGHPIPISGAWE